MVGVPTPPSAGPTPLPAILKPGGRDPYPPLHDPEGYPPPGFAGTKALLLLELPTEASFSGTL